MAYLQVLLLLLFVNVSLMLVANFDDSVEGSYFFLLNDDDKMSTIGKKHDKEFERTKEEVRNLLPNGASIGMEFRFNKARGFLVSGKLTQDQLREMGRQMGNRGTFEPNRRIKVDLPRKFNIQPMNNASASAACTGKTCCSRTVSVSQNSNLDWLDGTRDGKYCAPGDQAKTDVFVLDTGVDRTHPEFAGRVADTDDCSVNGGPAPWTPNVDIEGHGTHVAGTIGSTSYGATTNVNIHSIKVLNDDGSGNTDNMLCGYKKLDLWLKNNPSKKAIVSMSLGFGGISAVMDKATSSIATTYARRLVIVVAAGNDNANACDSTFASVKEVVAVGSTSATLSESRFSNFGSCVDIMAPGENILSTAPSGRTAVMSGTSMATPLVSGVLAQYWMQNPTLTGLAIRTAIGSSSSTLFVPTVVNRKPGSPNKLIQYACPWGRCTKI